MEIRKLSEANPWWATGKVDDNLKGRLREEQHLLLKSIGINEVTIITGVRRSGKSTLMYQMIDKLLTGRVAPEQVLFVNLEDTKLEKDSLDDIYQEYRENINPAKKAYIFLDEIHKRPKWEAWIRRQYDLRSDCKFIISGSCAYLLRKEYSTLLTGRNLTFEIYPLSFKEYLAFKGISIDPGKVKKSIITEKDKNIIVKAFRIYLVSGGFPAAFFTEEDFQSRLLSQYFDDIIYKDIIDRYSLNSQKTKELALYLLTNFTSLISLRNLRSTLGLSYESVKDYLSAYKEAYLFFTIDHFSYSMKEQKTSPSKIYCIDNGLRNAVSFKFSKDEGKLAENLVFLELKRRGKDAYYWKDSDGEVDFIIKNNDQTLTAINVTYTDEITSRETKPLMSFKSQFKKTKEIILLTKNLEKNEQGIRFIPLWKWLLEQ